MNEVCVLALKNYKLQEGYHDPPSEYTIIIIIIILILILICFP
jgi:hypothetical protein